MKIAGLDEMVAAVQALVTEQQATTTEIRRVLGLLGTQLCETNAELRRIFDLLAVDACGGDVAPPDVVGLREVPIDWDAEASPEPTP